RASLRSTWSTPGFDRREARGRRPDPEAAMVRFCPGARRAVALAGYAAHGHGREGECAGAVPEAEHLACRTRPLARACRLTAYSIATRFSTILTRLPRFWSRNAAQRACSSWSAAPI